MPSKGKKRKQMATQVVRSGMHLLLQVQLQIRCEFLGDHFYPPVDSVRKALGNSDSEFSEAFECLD